MIIILAIVIKSILIDTLVPLNRFGAFISRIKMHALFPLHQSTSCLVFLSHIRLLPLYSGSGDLFRLLDRSMLVVVGITEGLLPAEVSRRLLPHHRSLVGAKFLVKATATVDLLGSWAGGGTTMRAPLVRLLISELWRGLWLIDNVFAFWYVTFRSYY